MGDTIEPIYVALGAAVFKQRCLAGWTQQDLAGQVGLSRTSIANVELGQQRLMLHQIVALADAFSISVGDLLGVGIAAERDGVSKKALRDEIVELRRSAAALRGALSSIAEKAASAASN